MKDRLGKFKELLSEIPDLRVKPIHKPKTKRLKYNDSYAQRVFVDKVVKGLHQKSLKYPKEYNEMMKLYLAELKSRNTKEEMEGINSINDMIIYAIEQIWINPIEKT